MTTDDELQRIFDLHERVQLRKTAGDTERQIWIAAARRIFVPGDREPCWVCGKFKSIAQAHHVVPLTAQYDRGFEVPDGEYLWLCPNHHAMAHMFIPDDGRSLERRTMRARTDRAAPLHQDLSEPEFEKILEIMRRSARGPE